MFTETFSPTIGGDNDGMILGRFLESGFKKVLSDSHLAGNVYVYVKEKSGTSFSYRTYTKAEVEVGITPWTLAQMSVGDEIGIACDHDSVATYLRMSTAGNWTGTMEFRYSSNGTSPNVLLQNVVDGTNRLTSLGMFGISYTNPTDEKTWSPAPEEITARKWKVFRIATLTSATIAPVINGVEVQHPAGLAKYIEHSNVHVISPAPAENTATFFPLVDSSVYYCVENPIFELIYNVYKKMANIRTRVMEYESSEGVFTAFASNVDPANDFKNGPTSYTTTPTRYVNTFTKPTNWVRTTKSFTKTDDTVVTETGYWFRKRTTAVSTFGPTTPATVAVRNKQSGADTTKGILFSDDSATQIKGLTLSEPLLAAGSGAITINVIDMNTGVAVELTIPDDATYPLNLDVNNFSLAAGEKLGLKYVGGTKILEDVPVIIHKKIS